MVRHRRLTAEDVFQPLGEIAFGVALIGFVVGIAAVLLTGLACFAAVLALEWLHEHRVLGPIACAGMIAAVVLHFTGCASAPRHSSDPRNPDVWRPSAPAVYPLPR